ncbi:MAG: DEAD/DEAH box helicase family protein [Verrucomicrobiaceae bacterium]|nr:DEAD/DEAH box helicase family protein [Verrucomicrobiaceae bacterium]
MDTAVPGQRWVSNTEAELGLGVVLKAEYGRMEIFYPAAGEMRQYAVKSAPLRRVKFKEGDSIKTHEGESFVVSALEEQGGLIIYKCGKKDIPESQLADTISFSKPEDRLLAGQMEDIRTYNLRAEALEWRSKIQRSPVRGFVGGRVDLLGHQLYIANEVSRRLKPRVLLADEVGLGKTIEAGLILHRLVLTGRANRVLIVVPEALVNQWFVELLRRFNLIVSVFDEARCEDFESDDAEANPFLGSQHVLCAASFLAESPKRAMQCLSAGWDLVIVDEAHHLEWTPQGGSPAYEIVAQLAAKTEGLLLITATPQQLGREGHFARLRLLDPERYDNLEAFCKEADHYEAVAVVLDRLLSGGTVTSSDETLFASKSERVKKLLEDVKQGREGAREELTDALLDEFGTGRVMFRNTRSALKGFPERKAVLHSLEDESDEGQARWLAALLKQLGEAKVLAICRTADKAVALQAGLARQINVSSGVFHEGMTLMQRDRAAVHFADEEGARILICSEIGSEGRNFQFSHHLVLLDLPENPELLEQRIGRLDRIGQTATINIHVPYVEGSASEALARWYHEGLNAFEKHPHAAMEVLQEVHEALQQVMTKVDGKALSTLIKKTNELHAQAGQKLERGRDRLLEINSYRAKDADATIQAMREMDEDLDFEDFIVRLMDRIGMVVEEHGNRSYVFRPGDLMTDTLPTVPPDGLLVTFDRKRALSRDNISFLTVDHPLVRGALDYFLGSETGNSCFGVWEGAGDDGLALDVTYVIESVAPAALHVERFLPMTPVRIIVDHAQTDLTNKEEAKEARLVKGDASKLLDNAPFRKKLMPAMLKKAGSLASDRTSEIVHEAAVSVTQKLNPEIDRLEDLALINQQVTMDEVNALKRQKEDLQLAIRSARHRLDSVRLILRKR